MVFITPTVINVLGFKINTLDNGAVANMGSLQLIDQLVSYKRNQALGNKTGIYPLSIFQVLLYLTLMAVIVLPIKNSVV